MGLFNETTEAIVLDEYIDALLNNSNTPPPSELDPVLAQLAQTIMVSLNQDVEYPVLLDIWRDSLAQAQYLATQSVAHPPVKLMHKGEPTLNRIYRPARQPQKWSSSLLMSSMGIAAILLMVMMLGVYQLTQSPDAPTNIQSAQEKATASATNFSTTTPHPTLEDTVEVVVPNNLSCELGGNLRFNLPNVGQAVSVVSSDVFTASVDTITNQDNVVVVNVICLTVGEIELAVTIVQDLESFSETINLSVTETNLEIDSGLDAPSTPIVVTSVATARPIPSSTRTPVLPTQIVLSPTPTAILDVYPAPVITSNLPSVIMCGLGGEIALEYNYNSASEVFTASRMIASNNNVRDRVVTTDDGIGILVMVCDQPGTVTATLYVFYPEFGIPPATSIATTHTMQITVTQATAIPVTPDPNYPVPIYTNVPSSLTCNMGDSQRVDIGFSANPDAAPGVLWFGVSSANSQIADAHSSSSNQVDSGFFWFDCFQVGSTTITIQLYRMVDSGDPPEAAHVNIPVTVNSSATATPDPNYPVPSFVSLPSITNCAPNSTIQIPFSYSANSAVGGPVNAFASASSANQNILIEQLTHSTNASTVHLQCNSAGMGKVTLYIYKEGDISFADMQAGNWSKANQHQFNVNVIAPTPSPNVSPTLTAIP